METENSLTITADHNTIEPRKRRRYEDSFKKELVALCRRGDQSVAQIAMDHRVNANLLRRWISQETPATTQSTRMAPVSVMPSGGDFIEVTLASGVVRISGSQDPATISAVIQALR